MITMKSIYRKTGMMVAVLVLLVVMSAPTVMAIPAQLRLETIPEGTYVGSSEDDWLKESWVTTDTLFDLQINNHNGKNIYHLYLLVAVDRVPAGNVTVSVDGSIVSTYDGVITTNSNALVSEVQKPNVDGPYEYPGHGVYKYGSDTHFAVIEILISGDVGDTLDAGEHISVPIEITPLVSAVKVHFDAIGADDANKAITFVPPSHDVTYGIPEFTTIAIPIVALLGLFAFYRRKQKK